MVRENKMKEKEIINAFLTIVDGTETFIPVKAIKLGSNKYKVLEYDQYDPKDRSVLYEFKPNDIVNLKKKVFSDGSIGLLIYRYVDLNDEKEIDINQFLFRILTNHLSLKTEIHDIYKKHITEIEKEIDNNIWYYHQVKDWLKSISGAS